MKCGFSGKAAGSHLLSGTSSAGGARTFFAFGKDELAQGTEINSLSKPMLLYYYSDAVRNWR